MPRSTSRSRQLAKIFETNIITVSNGELTSGSNAGGGGLDSAEVLSVVDSSRPRFITMMQTGSITTPFVGVSRAYPPGNINLSNVSASVGTAPSTNLVFNLLKNGVEVGNYTLSASNFKFSTSENISASASDYFTLDVDSGSGATDLKVDLTYRFV